MEIVFLSKLKSRELLAKVRGIVGDHDPQSCYECMKCTSGCPVSKIYPEFAPHKIVSLTRMGFVEDLVKGQEIWQCAQCLTCKERCPQSVAPSDLIIALRNIAYIERVDVPKGFKLITKKIYGRGMIGDTAEIMSREMEFFDREVLGLPTIELKNVELFQKEMDATKLVKEKKDKDA
ncbi:MAG: 4Fe-4S dicluster domain-containing protein [Candidatus Heimdallarchaeota archaeon]